MENKLGNKRGFTLLEVIIAITILAFLSVFTARMIQQGLQAKTKIQGQIDRTGQLTSALQLMTRDMELAFHYRDFNTELYNAAQKSRQERKKAPADKDKDDAEDKDANGKRTIENKTPNPDAGTGDEEFPLKEEKTYTRFFGEEEKLNFTSLNNFRSAKDMQQSDQAEIGYRLDTCSGRLKKDTSSTCLWRRMSPYIDEDITEGGKERVLLENVKSIKFRYLGEGEEEWVNTWKTEGGTEKQKDHFPIAVEITLIVLDKRTDPPKDLAMTVVAALRFSNNKPEETSTEESPDKVN